MYIVHCSIKTINKLAMDNVKNDLPIKDFEVNVIHPVKSLWHKEDDGDGIEKNVSTPNLDWKQVLTKDIPEWYDTLMETVKIRDDEIKNLKSEIEGWKSHYEKEAQNKEKTDTELASVKKEMEQLQLGLPVTQKEFIDMKKEMLEEITVMKATIVNYKNKMSTFQNSIDCLGKKVEPLLSVSNKKITITKRPSTEDRYKVLRDEYGRSLSDTSSRIPKAKYFD